MVQKIKKRDSRFTYCLKLTLGLILILPTAIMGQTSLTATGTVVDEKGEPLTGVSITINGTSKGTLTDLKGNFSIQAEAKSVVTFSYIGYLKKSLTASTLKNKIVALEENQKTLDEIVVVGYGNQRKKETTGATFNVKGDDIEKVTASDLGTAIQLSLIHI